MGHTSQQAGTALMCSLAAMLAACPAASVAGGGLRFECEDESDCLAGQTCQAGLCTVTASSADAGQVQLDGAAADRPPLDGAADATASDGQPAEAALDASGAERLLDDAAVDDATATDAQVDGGPGTDTGAPDGTGPDAATADGAGTADVLLDVDVGDAGADDTAIADVGASDTVVSDAAIDDAAVSDGAVGDSPLEDAGTADAASVDTATVDSSVPADWVAPAWRVRRTLIVDSAGLTEVLSDVPVLVRLRAGNTDYTRIQDQGQDLRFYLVDGSGPLAHEIEHWDESGDSFVWVKVPSLDVSSDGHALLHVYYDNPAAADRQRPAEVWSNGFVGVWHMNGSPTQAGAIRDSSPSGAHGTGRNMVAGDQVSGQIGQALDFDGADDVVDIDGSATAGSPLDIVGGPMTLSAWIFARAPTGTLIARRNDSAVQWQLQIGEQTSSGEHSIDYLWANAANAQNLWSSNATFQTGGWRYVTAVVGAAGNLSALYTGDTWRAFTKGTDSGGSPVHRTVDVSIGSRWAGGTGTGFSFNGVVDEVRVETIARSQDWVVIQRRSMTFNLFTMGALETLP